MNKSDTSTVVMVGGVPLKRAPRTLHEELLPILSRARLSRYRSRDFTCGYGAGTFGRTAARAQVRAAATGHRKVVLSSSSAFADGLPGAAVKTTTRRSSRRGVRTSQSTDSRPSSG